jgi:RNA 3'-terminal phosphate cyclase (ATP)
MLIIDGSTGEGGGQILRTALALSICQSRSFRIEKIRRTRDKPGLRQQHLSAVNAAAVVSHAEVHGAELGADCLEFFPERATGGEYRFDIGTAGSTTLVLQTILPPLLLARHRSRITIIGGTHNPNAPPFEFIQQAFLPLLKRMGAEVAARLVRAGFYPRGGGCIEVNIEPVSQLQPLTLMERGRILSRHVYAAVSHLPRHIAEREAATLTGLLGIDERDTEIQRLDAYGPGNVVTVTIGSENITEVFTGFGELGVPAEDVAANVAREVTRYLATEAPVGPRLADQLLIPLALAGHGAYKTLTPTRHTLTNIGIIKQFLDVNVELLQLNEQTWVVRFG